MDPVFPRSLGLYAWGLTHLNSISLYYAAKALGAAIQQNEQRPVYVVVNTDWDADMEQLCKLSAAQFARGLREAYPELPFQVFLCEDIFSGAILSRLGGLVVRIHYFHAEEEGQRCFGL